MDKKDKSVEDLDERSDVKDESALNEIQFTFDKFMDDVVVKESRNKKKNLLIEETPARKYLKKYHKTGLGGK